MVPRKVVIDTQPAMTSRAKDNGVLVVVLIVWLRCQRWPIRHLYVTKDLPASALRAQVRMRKVGLFLE